MCRDGAIRIHDRLDENDKVIHTYKLRHRVSKMAAVSCGNVFIYILVLKSQNIVSVSCRRTNPRIQNNNHANVVYRCMRQSRKNPRIPVRCAFLRVGGAHRMLNMFMEYFDNSPDISKGLQK
jgi:hypothetical protein